MSIPIRVLTDRHTEECCSMPEAIEAMRVAFSNLSSGKATVPVRTNIQATEQTESLIMPVAISQITHFGLKAVSLTDDNSTRGLPRIHAAVLLFDSTTGQPAGLINGEYLTALRTGAASGLATTALASEAASHLVVFGCGRQAKFQTQAILNVRQINKVTIVARDINKADTFCVENEVGLDVEFVPTTNPEVVSEADVVCTATTSTTPLFDAERLREHCHVNAIGSYRADMKELSPGDLPKFKVFVDQLQACKTEAGEIVQAIQLGHIQADDLTELGSIEESESQHRHRRTLFKSVGNAVQDLVISDLILRKANLENLGTVVSI